MFYLFFFIQSAFQLLSYPRFISVLLVFVKLVLISLRSALIITDENWPHIAEQTTNFCTRQWEEENENNREFVIHCNQLIGRPSCWATNYQFPFIDVFPFSEKGLHSMVRILDETSRCICLFAISYLLFCIIPFEANMFYFLKTRAVKMEEMRRSVIIAPTLDGIHFLAPTNRPSFLPPPPLLSFLYFFASPVVLYLHGTDRVSEWFVIINSDPSTRQCAYNWSVNLLTQWSWRLYEIRQIQCSVPKLVGWED